MDRRLCSFFLQDRFPFPVTKGRIIWYCIKGYAMQCDVFTVSPIKVYNQKIQFAPIGLTNMYNSGGAVESVDLINDSSSCKIHIKGRGGGSFGAYSSTKPSSIFTKLKK